MAHGGGELRQFQAFLRASEQVVAQASLQEKLDVVARGVVEAGLFRRCLVSVYHHDRADHRIYGSAGVSPELLASLSSRRSMTREEFLSLKDKGIHLGGQCYYIPGKALTGLPGVLPSERKVEEFQNWHPDDMFIAYLISTSGTYLGNLSADDPFDGKVPTAESVRTLSLFASLAADLLEREIMFRMDSLTQFYNASYLDEVLRRLDSTPDDIFAVMYVDLDGLKMVNDTYGHRVGDAFIRAAARLVAEAAGPGATLFRPYGDEFVAIGEPSTLVEAPATLARLTWKWNRTERASLFAPTPEGFDASPSLTMSAGVAVRTPGQRAVEVLQAAEARMYQEKKAFYGMWEGAQEEGRDPTSPGQPTEGPPQTRP